MRKSPFPLSHRSLLLSQLLLLISLMSLAQTPSSEQATKNTLDKLTTWSESNLQEKVYLHFDKEIYLEGQTIWYKAYAITEPLGQLDTLSKTLYVEFVNAKSEIIERQMIYLEAGLGNGRFDLPDDIGSGLYYLRAYTNWMRNFDDAFYFLKPFEIKHTRDQDIIRRESIDLAEVDLQFFPEGGDLLTGMYSKLAFKAVNGEGRAVDVNGKIYDSYGQEVTAFQTRQQGMGWVYFTPEADQSYYARIEEHSGEYKLPVAREEGYIMGVNNSDDKNMTIVLNSRLKTAERAEPYVIVQTDGRAYQVIKNIAFDGNGQALLFVPKKGLPTGIAQITLFNGNGLPEAERLVFVDNDDQLRASVKAKGQSYGPRQEVELTVKVEDTNGNPVKGSFSMAVVNDGFKSRNRFGGSIATDFLLTSDLHGFIDNPEQYFDEENAYRKEDLDLLMAVNGWRRFTWKALMDKKKSKLPHALESAVSLSGTVYKLSKRSAPERGATVSFIDLNTGSMVATSTETDGKGRFSFTDLMFDSQSSAMLKAQTKKGRENLRFVLDQKQMDTLMLEERKLDFLDEQLQQRNVDASEIDQALWNQGQFVDLGEFVIRNKPKSDRRAKKMQKTSYGGRVLEVEELMESQPNPLTILDLLIGRLASLSVNRYGSAPTQISVQSARGRKGMYLQDGELVNQEMLFVLDGQIVDQSLVMTITPNSIESIEVLVGNSAAMFGLNGGNGVISLTSRADGGPPSNTPLPGASTLETMGYTYAREFYAPRYDVEDPSHEEPDQRSLLHWVPNILTNDAGEAKVSFFTGDIEGIYVIDFQGLGFNGKVAVNRKEEIKVER